MRVNSYGGVNSYYLAQQAAARAAARKDSVEADAKSEEVTRPRKTAWHPPEETESTVLRGGPDPFAIQFAPMPPPELAALAAPIVAATVGAQEVARQQNIEVSSQAAKDAWNRRVTEEEFRKLRMTVTPSSRRETGSNLPDRDRQAEAMEAREHMQQRSQSGQQDPAAPAPAQKQPKPTGWVRGLLHDLFG